MSAQKQEVKLIDVDRLRDAQVRLGSLTKADVAYTFYHDETNNIRKLHIKEGRLNVAELKVFVLGGVVHEGPEQPIDIRPLRTALRIQKTADEIKLEHVAKGDFLSVLRSTKLTTFLEWVMASRLTVHYHQLDPLYWSIVDIIDSILPKLENRVLVQHHALLKSDLAEVLRSVLGETVQLFHEHGYPGLAPESRKPFLNALIDLLEHYGSVLPEFNAMMLKGVLQGGRSLDALDFIEGYPSHLLIDDFSTFYLNRIALFKNSKHILDMEEVIRDRLLETPLTSDGKPFANYRFADSKAEPGIQVADVVVGLLGKMHTYFIETSHDEVAEDRNALSGPSLQNANLLRNLISASHETNVAFLHHVASGHDVGKLDLFLRFLDGAHAG